MLGNHIASALARERQRELVPELRELERTALEVEDGEVDDARALAGGPRCGRRLWARFGRVPGLGARGRSQAREQAP
jgi:hypothetical protein